MSSIDPYLQASLDQATAGIGDALDTLVANARTSLRRGRDATHVVAAGLELVERLAPEQRSALLAVALVRLAQALEVRP